MTGARRVRTHLLVLGGYLLLTIVMTWPLVRTLTAAIPGDSFDGWQNYWNLWWIKLALVDRGQLPLFTDMLYAPTGVGLYFHTLNPFNGLATLPVQLAAGLIPAYNTVVMISWVLTGYGVFLLARWLLRPARTGWAYDGGAFLAGVIFTFAPFHMAHLLGHMQVMSLEWIPFYVLYLLRSLRASRHGAPWLGRALLAGFFLTLVGLCDWYFVLYLFFFTGITLLWSWWQGRRSASSARAFGRALLPPVTAGAVFVVLLSPMLLPMVREATRFSFMVRPSSDLFILSASVMDFLVPNRLHTLARPESFTWIGNQIAPVSERTIAVGYGALGLAALALWRMRPRAWLWALTAGFFFLMALGPILHLGNITWESLPADPERVRSWTPFAVFNRLVPFMRISRSVSRYALMVQFALAVLAGLGAAWLLAGPARRVRGPVFGLLLVGLLAEYWVAPYPMSPPDTPAFYAELAQEPGGGALLNLPMNYDRPGYLLYQTVHGRPLTVAYISRDDPRTLTERVPLLQHFRHLGPDILADDPAMVGLTVLADLGVEYVVLDRYKMPGGLEREYTETLAAALFAGQSPRFEDDRLTVYAVEPAARPAPYLQLGALNWGPLLTAEDGSHARALLPGEATLTVKHLPDRASLRLRYRSTADAQVRLTVGDTVQLLPPRPDGGELIVPLDAPRAGGEISAVFDATRPESVWIQSVKILTTGD